MARKNGEKYSIEFGKKEKVLNYACQTYQLSRPSKVGAVMALIRQCQPQTIEEWEKWYFENAVTANKNKIKITPEILTELGTRLYEKIITIVIPEWQEAFNNLTQKDCIEYIFNLTINRTYDGYIREKSVINDSLAKIFPKVSFKESNPKLDHSCDIDYVAKINNKQIGIQIKPITAQGNNLSKPLTERMKASFANFEKKYGGKVFVVYSLAGEIANTKIIDEIKTEIERLSKIK